MQSNKSKPLFLQSKILIPSVVVLLAAAAAVALFNRAASDSQTTGEMPTFVVRQGPLRISVIESGTIKAREQIILMSEVEGKTTILTLVEEGTLVKKGDLLIELDASLLLDQKIDQEIQVENDDAAFIGARENLAVVVNQAQSDIDQAELTLDFARLDMKKYLEGEYENQRNEAEALINLAEEELKTAQKKLDWSETLYKEKYLSQTELEIDQLAVKKKKLDLELARNNLKLLEEFTHPRTVIELESNVKQAGMALERAKRKAKADVIQAKADLRAKESELGRQKDKLRKNQEQIKKAKIYAPADGLVIYATSARTRGWRSSQEPLDVGQEVGERQELIYLPTATAVKADVKIHEASLENVAIGLPAIVTVDAVPGRVFTGRVEKIAPLPDPVSVWLNPDLKVYNTDVYLDGDGSELRTGMSCRAEVIVKEYEDVIHIPVQAVLRVGGEPTVYVFDGKAFEPRKIKIGLDNNRMVHVESGLRPGEIVLLTPPLKSAEVEPFVGRTAAPETPADRKPDRQKRPRGKERSGGQRKPGRDMSPEQRRQMREKVQNMSPEQREEAKQQMTKRRQQTGTAE